MLVANGIHLGRLVRLLLEYIMSMAGCATVGIYRLGAHADAGFVLNLKRYAFRVFADACVPPTSLVNALGLSSQLRVCVSCRAVLGRQAKADRAWHAYQALVGALLKHGAVMSAGSVGRLSLVDLHLLDSSE